MARLLIFAAICSRVIDSGVESTAAPTGSQPAIKWEQSEAGETTFVPMESVPYPHPSQEKVHVYNKVTIPREPHYTDSTFGLFIPRGFRRTRMLLTTGESCATLSA